LLIDPNTSLPYVNQATITTYAEANVLNYSAAGAQGNFPTEAAVSIPGLPGTTGGDTNAAIDAVSYLYLTPGLYTLGVNSSDGFQLSAATTPDVFSLVESSFNGVRAAADTTVTFNIALAGYYPFRICYFVGGVEAVNPTTDNPSLEFFSQDALGNKVLINDVATLGHVAAYRPAQTLPYIRSVSPAPSSAGVPHGASVDAILVDAAFACRQTPSNYN